MDKSDIVYLYGAGGHAKVITDILMSKGITVKEVYDDNPNLKELDGIPIVHEGSYQSPLIVSIGNNIIRKKIVDRIHNIKYEKAIASTAIISHSVCVGEGSVVMQGAIIQSSTKIGKHAIINTGARVDHDCNISDFTHIAPGAILCGNVEIGEGSLIGAGATIIPGKKIGKWSVIGAGSTVIKDIPDNVVAIGSPCRIIKYIE
ncbi:MAG: acetyltransferase [Dysgonomonas sp.]